MRNPNSPAIRDARAQLAAEATKLIEHVNHLVDLHKAAGTPDVQIKELPLGQYAEMGRRVTNALERGNLLIFLGNVVVSIRPDGTSTAHDGVNPLDAIRTTDGDDPLHGCPIKGIDERHSRTYRRR